MVKKPINRKRFLEKKIKHIALDKIKDIPSLLEAFNKTSFQSRNLGACSEIFKKMLKDKDVTIFLGLSGALVPAGMKKIICEMIKHRLIDVLVSTGANLSHDFHESMGNAHYIGKSDANDEILCKFKIDRIYDTYIDDESFTRLEIFFANFPNYLENRDYSTREFFAELGKKIKSKESIIRACYESNVPIFCPALNDSAIGVGLTGYYMKGSKKAFAINPIRDNYEIMQIVNKSKSTGVIYLGGGVPKNYIQQIPPMLSLYGFKTAGHKYAIQLTTDDPKWGGLSGCTFEEAKSWGKVENEAKHATVYIDSTIGLPLLIGSILPNILKSKKRKTRIFIWDYNKLLKVMYE